MAGTNSNVKAPGAGAKPFSSKSIDYVMDYIVDFSNTLYNMSAAGNNVAPLFDVKAKQLLNKMTAEVLVAEGGASTIDIGLTGGDVDKFIDGADINAVAGTIYHSGSAAAAEAIIAAGGHMFTEADTIDLLCATGTLLAGKVRFIAHFTDLS